MTIPALCLAFVAGAAALVAWARCAFWRRRANHWFTRAMELEGEVKALKFRASLRYTLTNDRGAGRVTRSPKTHPGARA